jgi:hypothetical protein
MTPGWIEQVGGFAADKVEAIVGNVQEQITGRIDDVHLTGAVEAIIARGTQVSVCDDTAQKRQQMIAFGSEIHSTLTNLKDGSSDASILERIEELTAGDKVKAAMELAKDLDVAALTCVDKSVQMVNLMHEGLDSLPGYVKAAIDCEAGKQVHSKGLEDDFQTESVLKTWIAI